MNRFAFIVCRDNVIDFVIPEINLRGSEPTENITDVISLLINRLQRNGIRGYLMDAARQVALNWAFLMDTLDMTFDELYPLF